MSDFSVGDKVTYHPIIGRDACIKVGKITDIVREPNSFGCDVAWIAGLAGCVAMDHLIGVNEK